MAASSLLTLFTACILISTVQASELATSTPPDDDLKTGLNSSSCIPIVLRMTYCLDFLFTGSTLPTPTDQCCLRLKFTTELDFPCICDFFKSGKRWGHHKLNHTRAESLASTCGIPFPLPPIPFTSQEVQPALMSESPVPGPSGQETTDPVDEEQVEAPESSTAKPKLPRLLLG